MWTITNGGKLKSRLRMVDQIRDLSIHDGRCQATNVGAYGDDDQEA